MVDVTVEGLDMTYKVGQTTAKARLDAWMTPAHDIGPCRVRRSDRAMDAGLVARCQSASERPGGQIAAKHTPQHVVSVLSHL